MKKILFSVLLFYFAALPPLLFPDETERGSYGFWELAVKFDENKDYKKAAENYDKAIEVQKKSGKDIPYYWYSSAGYNLWLKLNDRENALKYFISIYNGNYTGEQKDTPLKEISHLNYLLMNYNEFLRYADLYLKSGRNENNKRIINDLLANYYYSSGNMEKALFYARKVGNDFWITKYTRSRNVTLTFKFRFRDLILKYHNALKNNTSIFIEMPLDTYYQKLISAKSNPGFMRIVKKERMNYLEYDFSKGFPEILEISCIVNIKIISRSPVNARQYSDENDEIGYYANETARRHELDYDLENPVLVNAVENITGDKKTIFDKLKTLNGWIDVNVPHVETLQAIAAQGKIKNSDIPVISNYKKLSDVYINRAGDCVMRPGLFAGMSRILKVPSRVLLVFVYNKYWDKPEGYLDGAHGLTEIYDPVQNEWIQTDLIPSEKLWSNHHYSIVCEYYTRTDKPRNYLNLMFLTQDAIKMGDKEAGKWSLQFTDKVVE